MTSSNATQIKDLDIIIPVELELDWPTVDNVVDYILEQYHNFGFHRFMLAGPCGGWRSVGYPPTKRYEELAHMFVEIRDRLLPYGIECGWWAKITLKSGRVPEFPPMIKADGSETLFSSCPLDEAFKKRFSTDIALFAKIAKPAFIITEDDFSILASTGHPGCLCELHLEEFARREGKYYSRQELLDIFALKTPESYELLRRYRQLSCDSLVGLAEACRQELDKETPEIPMGCMQPGGSDVDGNHTLPMAQAMAGPNHTPFCRFYGITYCGVNSSNVPNMLFPTLYHKQHITSDFTFYYEADTYPHTRFFLSAAEMRTFMATTYSYGFDGSTFNNQQLSDDPNEETIYCQMFANERARFNAMHRIAKQCSVKGVEVCYDPFWNTVDSNYSSSYPLWVESLGNMGFPYTTTEADVAFWDARQAKYASDATILKYLSKGLFLEGEAAKILCDRGYSEYLGVTVGEPVVTGNQVYDLGEREVICDGFAPESKGRTMNSAHMYCPPGNGTLLTLSVIDSACQVITEEYTFQKKYMGPAMTRFENKLGGKIVVMGSTLNNNHSQNLLNYRKQKVLQDCLVWCNPDNVFVKDAARVFTIYNEANDPISSGFKGMLTLSNLNPDPLEKVSLYLPKDLRENSEYYVLDKDGEWSLAEWQEAEDGITIFTSIAYMNPTYILIK